MNIYIIFFFPRHFLIFHKKQPCYAQFNKIGTFFRNYISSDCFLLSFSRSRCPLAFSFLKCCRNVFTNFSIRLSAFVDQFSKCLVSSDPSLSVPLSFSSSSHELSFPNVSRNVFSMRTFFMTFVCTFFDFFLFWFLRVRSSQELSLIGFFSVRLSCVCRYVFRKNAFFFFSCFPVRSSHALVVLSRSLF